MQEGLRYTDVPPSVTWSGAQVFLSLNTFLLYKITCKIYSYGV